jgi:hypothetical protein
MVVGLAVVVVVGGCGLIAIAIWLSEAVSPRRAEDGRGVVVLLKVFAAWLLFPLALVASIIAIPILWPKRRRIRAEEREWMQGQPRPLDAWLASKPRTDDADSTQPARFVSTPAPSLSPESLPHSEDSVRLGDRFQREAPVLWDQPGFRVAFNLYVVSWVVGVGASLLAPDSATNVLAVLIGIPLFAALLWAMWHWGRNAGSSWPKWCLLVFVGLGALGPVLLGFTLSPLRLVQWALAVAALVVLLRGWPRRDVRAPNLPLSDAATWTKRGERWYCLRHGLTSCEQCPNRPVST